MRKLCVGILIPSMFLCVFPLLKETKAQNLDEPLKPYFKRIDDLGTDNTAPYLKIIEEGVQASPSSPDLDEIDQVLITSATGSNEEKNKDASPANTNWEMVAATRMDVAFNSTFSDMANSGASYGDSLYGASQASALAGYQAELEKQAAWKRFHNIFIRMLKLRSYYKQGAWYEAYKLAGTLPEDSILAARALKRAIEQGNLPKTKNDMPALCQAAYVRGLIGMEKGFGKALFLHTHRVKLFWEMVAFSEKMFKDASDAERANVSKRILAAAIATFHSAANVSTQELEKMVGLAASEAMKAQDKTLYDDCIYALEFPHLDAKKAKKNPEFNVNDAFLIAGLYKEATGEKADALEVWLNYLDFAGFNVETAAQTLYLNLAKGKSEALKKELGANAKPHETHYWGISSEDLKNKTIETEKDKERKQKGLEW